MEEFSPPRVAHTATRTGLGMAGSSTTVRSKNDDDSGWWGGFKKERGKPTTKNAQEQVLGLVNVKKPCFS
jgi:hypothetical protein